ncbi:ELL-associated factor 2-like isoform X2 [Patiria miniata]|uniref:Transcription elongation factor Eaf N-terminal domain-containing protein n=1 Tax=Patiria miniata TaxID=46514 RepID=A0A914BL63_PATMI|nr:ELL-associated factor 2-like isoform X2 [Patiria miniata]
MDKSSSSTMPDTALFGTEPHQLKLGRSFDRDKHRAFHTIRYDFKPASVDHSKEAVLEVGEGHEVNITLPNVESKGTTCTKFKGSKRSLQKECVLIYDHRTGEFTLERLTCNMQVKKQREEGTSKAQQSRLLAGLDSSTNLKNSPNLTSTSSKSKRADLSSTNAVLAAPDIEQGGEISPLQPSPLAPSPHTPPSHQASYHHDDSDSSSSYITDSDSDDNDNKGSSSSSSSGEENGHDGGGSQALRNGSRRHPQAKSDSPPRGRHLETSQNSAQYLRSQLSQDLQLSDESDSDSD